MFALLVLFLVVVIAFHGDAGLTTCETFKQKLRTVVVSLEGEVIFYHCLILSFILFLGLDFPLLICHPVHVLSD